MITKFTVGTYRHVRHAEDVRAPPYIPRQTTAMGLQTDADLGRITHTTGADPQVHGISRRQVKKYVAHHATPTVSVRRSRNRRLRGLSLYWVQFDQFLAAGAEAGRRVERLAADSGRLVRVAQWP
jgi:hypothetical protein